MSEARHDKCFCCCLKIVQHLPSIYSFNIQLNPKSNASQTVHFCLGLEPAFSFSFFFQNREEKAIVTYYSGSAFQDKLVSVTVDRFRWRWLSHSLQVLKVPFLLYAAPAALGTLSTFEYYVTQGEFVLLLFRWGHRYNFQHFILILF